MHRLTPQVMHYAWGSHDAIAQLTGRPGPTREPEAELWMGAHEHAPSSLRIDGRDVTLDKLVESDPASMLGDSCAQDFESRLPFLLKVLAPEQVLSIQCHPDARQARGAAAGTYVDSWPKPEAWLAITEFEIFAGTKPFEQMRSWAAALGARELMDRVEAVSGARRPMYALLFDLLHLEPEERIALVRSVVAACHDVAPDSDDGSAAVVARVAEMYPDDVGLVVLLLMQHHVLAPGSYVFIPAGILHTPVSGTIVEILANSDNVVRAGLTPKKLNIEELLRIVDVDKVMEPAQPSVEGRARTYPSDASHFQLHTVAPGDEAHSVPGGGSPRIMLALHESVTLQTATETLQLAGGESCFVPASEGPVSVSGKGELFVATTGPTAR